ncbi:MAG: hypothetical protein V1874_10445, partial [Spirochaetota bacterium]
PPKGAPAWKGKQYLLILNIDYVLIHCKNENLFNKKFLCPLRGLGGNIKAIIILNLMTLG